MSVSIPELIQSAFEHAEPVYERILAERELMDTLVEAVQHSLEAESTPQKLDLFKSVLAVQSTYQRMVTDAWDAMQALDALREEQP